MGLQRPLPEVDTDARTFWEGASKGKLLIQRCKQCGGHQHYARPFCVKCHGNQVEMVEASGRGTTHSFTVVYRGPYDDMEAPYVVALVKLEEGVTLLTNIVGCEPERVACDMPVRVTYRALRDDFMLPVFEPRSEV